MTSLRDILRGVPPSLHRSSTEKALIAADGRHDSSVGVAGPAHERALKALFDPDDDPERLSFLKALRWGAVRRRGHKLARCTQRKLAAEHALRAGLYADYREEREGWSRAKNERQHHRKMLGFELAAWAAVRDHLRALDEPRAEETA